MGRGERPRGGRVEVKKETLALLRAWAAINLQRKLPPTGYGRGISPKSKGVDLSWVRCAGGRKVIESFRFDKFLDRIVTDGECIIFTGTKSPQGYGSFQSANRVRMQAHRISYQVFVGPLIDGLVIDHICRNRLCVRPDHLRQVTHQVNILAGVGATAVHAKKTHCVNGHEYTTENTHRTRHGRACKICRKEKKRVWDINNREHRRQYRKEQRRLKQ